jgi:predicted ATPase/DNA-binding SARP family transcriptional activator
MEFHVLGSLEVRADGHPVEVRGARRRLLLATLILHRNAVVSVDQLVDVLFGTDPPDRAVGTVQSYVSRLRGDLGGGEGRLQTRPSGYTLSAGVDDVDAARFERAVTRALGILTSDPGAAAEILYDAHSWWRGGRAFAEFTDDLALQAEGTRIGEVRQRSFEALVDAQLTLGHHAGAIDLLETCIGEWPLRERFRAQQMLALHRAGRQPEALRAYQRFRSALGSELGLEPSPDLTTLESRILLQDPGLDFELSPISAKSEQVPSPGPARPLGNLPLPLNGFVGRDDDLVELAALLDTAHLLTITGPGGVGKTRLAMRVAELSADRYPDGVWVCDLAAVREPAMAADAVATALDVQRRQDRSTLEGLVEVLQPRRQLVAFDNCEHLLAPIGEIAEVILRACPGVRILATSREPLAVEGETVWPLRPLPLPDPGELDPTVSMESPAVRLFVDRATAASPGFRLTPETVGSIVEICHRLDGVPLAIELAAARVRSMAPADLAGGLDERFTLLTSGRRTEPRHQTLLATVEWSYDLLESTQQALFDRLSVFAGAFTVGDVTRVCADDTVPLGEVTGVLAALVDKSMVMADTAISPTRYLLLETLREFGRERLAEAGTTEQLQHRHASHFVTRVEQAEVELGGSGEAESAARLDDSFGDLRIAHRWALAEGDIDAALRLVAGTREFAFRLMRYELFTWAESTIGAQVDDEHPLTPMVLAIAAYGRFVRGDLGGALAMAERSLAVEQRLELPPCGLHWRTMGNVFYYRGQADQAAEVCQRMVRAARASGDDPRLVHALYMSSVGLASAGRTNESDLVAEESLSLARRIQNPTAMASALYARALSLEVLDPGRAASMLEEAVEHGTRVSNRWIVAFAQTELVSLASRRGELEVALRLARDVIDTWHRAGDWANQWLTLRHVAGVLTQRGDYEDAALLQGAVRVASAEMAMPIEASDLRRVGEILEQLPAALGPERLADAESRASAMLGDVVVRHTLATIARILPDG